MNQQEAAAVDAHLGTELSRRSAELTRMWLDRLLARLEVHPRRVFPSDTLLNHIPEVLKSVSDYLLAGGDRVTEELVREELTKLARLRREQGYDIDEILAEFEILGEILYSALKDEAESLGRKITVDYAIVVAERLYRALMAITAITANTFREEGFRDRRERARLLGSFGRDLAHELRNRLGTAEAALHVIEHSPDREAVDRSRHALAHSLERIKGVADDVQALAIAQGSEESAQGRRLSLRTLLEETLAEVADIASERGVRIESQEPIPDVQVDATRVELVLINLIGNAIKYSDQQKPDRWVRASARYDENGYWRIAIADNGIGIPSDMQGLVFEQFVRAHPDLADGTGLGLSIAREAISQLSGRIWLQSEPGAGTTFYFTVVDPPAARE
ncbi:MAG TPA: sensor histidine kinase [Thermoanaerobaculia bacterium]|nr:sensor histidine kinase [Thermoanaerobaculia bacterium]